MRGATEHPNVFTNKHLADHKIEHGSLSHFSDQANFIYSLNIDVCILHCDHYWGNTPLNQVFAQQLILLTSNRNIQIHTFMKLRADNFCR